MDGNELEDALDVLRNALEWQLPAHRWADVDRAVQAMVKALAQGDETAFLQAEGELELAGPVRAVSAENPPPEPVSMPIRERINELVHTLDGKRVPAGQSSDDDSAAG